MSDPVEKTNTEVSTNVRKSGVSSATIEAAIMGTLQHYKGKVMKADGQAAQSNAYEIEDEYRDYYIGATNEKGIIEPPYNLRALDRLAQENNALSPCIEAMVTNVDGTGYDFASNDDDAEDTKDDVNIQALTDFFSQPWPGLSFQTMRKSIRRELEGLGNAYLEVIRNPKDEILFLRPVDAKMMRLLRLDEPVLVEKSLNRNGKVVKTRLMQRERRFCQQIGGRAMAYFKEFGASRDLDKDSGEWLPFGQRLPAAKRATEIIHFTMLPDSHTPYGVPRWVSQMPSVLGSRQAEEFNMDFFDNGGVPPALIILQGGTMQPETRVALEQKVSAGSARSKSSIKVIEVEPAGGSIDKEAPVKVSVERFGAERQSDAMFENYDDKCEERVRRAFRLPPIFVGKASDYSFATAFASYTVAEAQVFKPERDEFDEIITLTIINAMGFNDYRMTSNPLVIEDNTVKLQGIEVAMQTGAVDMEDVLYEINEASGTNLKVREGYDQDAAEAAKNNALTVDAEGNVVAANNNKPAAEDTKATPAKKPSPTPVTKGTITELAMSTATALRKRDTVGLQKQMVLVNRLDQAGYEAFTKAAADLQFVDTSLDVNGLGQLASCTRSVIAGKTPALN